jgi:signal transduction histidine kinase
MNPWSDKRTRQRIPDRVLVDMLQEAWKRKNADDETAIFDLDRAADVLRERLDEYADRLKALTAQVKDQQRQISAQDKANLEMQASIEEWLTLQELAAAIRSARDIAAVSHTLMTLLPRVVPFTEGDVFLIDEQNRTLTAVTGSSPALSEMLQFHLDEGILDWVMTNGKPAMIPDVYPAGLCAPDAGRPDYMAIPLIVRGRGIGVVLLSLPADATIEDHALSLLTLLTDQAGVAIEQVRVYEELLEMQRMLETSYSYVMRSERLAAVEDLAAGVAHEINNPLQVISSSIELIRMGNDLPDPSKRFIEMIERESQRIATIVSDLINFARKDKTGMKIHPINVNDTIKRSLVLVRHQFKYAGITVTLDLSDGAVSVYAYEKELQQAFINILTHARRAMESDGTLTITTKPGLVWTTVQFTHTGSGPDDAVLAHILNDSPLHALKSGETNPGLGLSISWSLIKKYNGLMDIENHAGSATVTVKLPNRIPARQEEPHEQPVSLS